MTNRQLVMAFVDLINARAPEALAELMSADHTFIDAQGNEVIGREKMLAGWRGYFEWFPDYQIEVVQIFENGEEFGLFGYAGGIFQRQSGAELATARCVESYGERSKCRAAASLRRHEDSV